MVALFVVITFLLFITIDYFVIRAQGKEHPAFTSYKVFEKASLLLPEQIFLSKGHLWLQKIDEKIVKIGIDEFALKALGKIKVSPLPSEGTHVEKGDVLFEGVAGSHTIKFFSPVTGSIKVLNQSVVNKRVADPYEKDWLLIINDETMPQQLGVMQYGQKAADWLKAEVNRLKEFLTRHVADTALAGATMFDGGTIAEGAVAGLKDDAVAAFETEFLKNS